MSDVFELASSRRFDFNEGKPRAERKFVVTGAADESVVIALFGSTLPDQYDNYPNDLGMPYNMLAFTYDITKEPNALETWNVTMKYKAQIIGSGATNPTSTNLVPNEVGYRTARLSMSAEFQDAYRRFASVALMQAAASSTNETTDIGGFSIDVAGMPIARLHYRQEFTILITDQFLPDAQKIAEQIGTRNDAQFLNYPLGTVVFAGCNCETIPEVGRNSIEYRFIYDQAYHCIQYPLKANNGSPILLTADSGNLKKGSAQTVLYKQPFTYLTNFSNLSQYFSGL
jgi:hypothetical protein